MGGGRGEAPAVGVKLGGVVETDGVTEGVNSAVRDEDTVGDDDGELEGLALTDGGVRVAVAEAVGTGVVAEVVGVVVTDDVGDGLLAGIEVSVGVETRLSVGVGVSAAVGVRLSTRAVSDGFAAADDRVGIAGEIAGVS
ncbi:MAG: hypothetical protein BMS9Abin28_1804 [Anaerolineae bacterium]|nr:MAG: hypothetical protein BMS9Abin28_1804 [Anaerolineae bacterium]